MSKKTLEERIEVLEKIAVIRASEEDPEQVETTKFPFIIRGNSDKAYLVEKRWIKNPETLQKLGFTLNDCQTIEMTDFMRIKEGQPIDLKDEPIVEKPKIVPPPSMSQIIKKKDGNVLRKANKK